MLGFEAVSQTAQNIIRTGECVINLPTCSMVDVVNRLSRLTATNPVPAGKAHADINLKPTNSVQPG